MLPLNHTNPRALLPGQLPVSPPYHVIPGIPNPYHLSHPMLPLTHTNPGPSFPCHLHLSILNPYHPPPSHITSFPRHPFLVSPPFLHVFDNVVSSEGNADRFSSSASLPFDVLSIRDVLFNPLCLIFFCPFSNATTYFMKCPWSGEDVSRIFYAPSSFFPRYISVASQTTFSLGMVFSSDKIFPGGKKS